MLVACGSEAGAPPARPAPSGQQVVVEGDQGAALLALDDLYVYWTSTTELRRAPLDGGEAVTLATGSRITGLLAASGYVYFTDGDYGQGVSIGHISRVPRDGGAVETIARAWGPAGLSTSGQALYWSETVAMSGSDPRGSLWRAELDGTGRAPLTIQRVPLQTRLVADRDAVYFTSSGPESCAPEQRARCFAGGVYRVPATGGDLERLYADELPVGLVVNDRGLHWQRAKRPVRVMTAPPGGPARELARVDTISSSIVATDAEALYWALSSAIYKVPFDASAPSRIASGLWLGSQIIAADGWLYVTDTNGILRIATDGSANARLGPIDGPCPEPLGTPEERALTPRADRSLERLALRLDSGEFIARQATYDRVVTDVAAIRLQAPELADIQYFGSTQGHRFSVWFTDIGVDAVNAGEYRAWDCLNQAYQLDDFTVGYTSFETPIDVELRGVYDLERMAAQYATLPEARGYSITQVIQAGSELCATRSGDAYEYALDRVSDCPGLCRHEVHRFVSEAAGQISAAEVWVGNDGEPPPAWFTDNCP